MVNKAKSTPEPHDVLGYLLKHAAQKLSALSDKALEPFGIDSKDLGVLRVLAHREPTSQLAAANTLGIDRTTMVALLDSLEKKGIIARQPDPADRRRNVVELTEQGVKTYDAAEAVHNDIETEFLAPVSAAAAIELRRTLRVLLDH